jgi:hypothetical protein
MSPSTPTDDQNAAIGLWLLLVPPCCIGGAVARMPRYLTAAAVLFGPMGACGSSLSRGFVAQSQKLGYSFQARLRRVRTE